MNEKQYFDNINGYYVKDSDARIDLETMQIKPTVSYAHRGLSAEAPENTLAAIHKAGLHGCYGVEIDVQVTSDNEIILMHDSTVDRTTDGTGSVNELTSSYIESLNIDVGNYVDSYPTQKVPYLSEVLPLLNYYNLAPMLELKETWSDENLQDLIDMLYKSNLKDKVTIISFSAEHLRSVRALDKHIKLALLHSAALTSEIIDIAKEIGNCGISMNYSNNSSLSDELKTSMIDNKIEYGYWTLDNLDTIKTIKDVDAKVAFIVSNHGYGGVIKQKTKMFIGLLDANGFGTWQSKYPNYNSGYVYDNFSFELTSAENKEYTLTYETKFENIASYYNTVINIKIDGDYMNNYAIRTRTQNNGGFVCSIVNSSNEKITLEDLRTAIGNCFITISVVGY